MTRRWKKPAFGVPSLTASERTRLRDEFPIAIDPALQSLYTRDALMALFDTHEKVIDQSGGPGKHRLFLSRYRGPDERIVTILTDWQKRQSYIGFDEDISLIARTPTTPPPSSRPPSSRSPSSRRLPPHVRRDNVQTLLRQALGRKSSPPRRRTRKP